MWIKRVKRLLVIALAALVTVYGVRHIAAHQEEISRKISGISMAEIERNVLGAVSRIGRKDKDKERPEEKDQPALEIVEKKAEELIEEIKKLPQ